MLVAQAIPAQLGQVLTDGVVKAMLLQPDGSILGYKSVEDEEGDSAQFAIAIEASSLWQNYATIPSTLALKPELKDKPQTLRCCMVQCEGRQLCLMEISRLLLCLVAENTVGAGLLRAKANILAERFREPLATLFSQLGPEIDTSE